MNNFEQIEEALCLKAKLTEIRAEQLSLNKNDSLVLLQTHTFKSKQAYFVQTNDKKCAFVYKNEVEIVKNQSPNKIQAREDVRSSFFILKILSIFFEFDKFFS